MRIALMIVAASLGWAPAAAAAPEKPVLEHVVAHTVFTDRTLPEVATLLTNASGVPIKLSREIQQCVASGKRGCDWKINGEWNGQTLSQALDTLLGSTSLAYRIEGKSVVIIRRVVVKERVVVSDLVLRQPPKRAEEEVR
jgi:hypothetical protein